ncbi:SRPBCC family protein [Actinacidiphila glaucinigra]|uniref:SRPBCC family protein n=1 Tax=Actinacidiphila glaucinigra TaxID=235986 RepID=UPI002DDAC95E|nr:SRPBCC family protein [Actinacidiphila glaucinigra]WSD58334.1 SRPBCC family protein [Actinacidiphila glaucinigra]
MSEFERSMNMTASADRVFDRAEDLGRIESWLPDELHVRPAEPPAVTVHDDDTGRDAAALFRADRAHRRLEWGTREDDRYAGWLQVDRTGERTSEVTIHLSFTDESIVPPEGVVDRALDDSLHRLSGIVTA